MPEAKPRDTKHTVGIIAIWYFDKEHILIVQSVAEACYLEIKHIFILQNVQKVSNSYLILPVYKPLKSHQCAAARGVIIF